MSWATSNTGEEGCGVLTFVNKVEKKEKINQDFFIILVHFLIAALPVD